MAYKGARLPIPLGRVGLMTDAPMNELPPNGAIKANNIQLYSSRVEKSRGSAKYNSTSLGSPIVALHDWFPSPSTQRLIALTADGKAWRDTGNGTFTSNTAIASGLGALTPNAHFVEGGNETASASNNKKLYAFTGTSQVKVLTGDAAVFATISGPAADWATNYPTFGIIHNGRLFAFGNANGRHILYWSTLDNHSDFVGSGSDLGGFLSVFPGKGEGLISAKVYRGVLYLFKRPFGVYYLDDVDPDPNNWAIREYSDAFGLASPHAVVQSLSDLIGANASGSHTSLTATEKFGDLESGDVLANLKVEEYFREISTPLGIPYTQGVYYEEKKTVYFTFRSEGGTAQNRMLVLDTNGQTLKITIETKDQPTCLSLRKDSNGISRPIYGSDDGFVYQMDQSEYSVAGNPYVGEFQTPFMDCSILDPSLADKTKLFDFLTLSYIPTGSWPFYVDVYIDDVFSETLTYNQFMGATLGNFILDQDVLGGGSTRTLRLPLHGSGDRISFRIYNGLANQNFRVENMVLNFRPGAEKA